MAHNTRPLKRAQDGVAPQYYNPTTDEYEALHGTAGANHVVIYGPDGQPAALATEAKLEAARALLESLDGKDFASETTLAAMETELELLKAELADVKTMLTDGTAKGEVTLSGNIAESFGRYSEPMPIAIPKTPLKLELLNVGGYLPRTIGIDGAVYCQFGTKIAMTGDAFSTAPTLGCDFAPASASWCTRTHAGYVVLADQQVWFSTEFDAGFSQVHEIDRTSTNFARSVYHGNDLFDSVILIGEYTNDKVPHKLHASFDGGQTWKVIRETVVNSTSYNAHCHCTIWDPYRGRIWAAQGDTANAMLVYSDDLGNTWKEVSIDIPEGWYLQPTSMLALPNRLVGLPDSGSTRPPCVVSLIPSKAYILPDGETFDWRMELAIRDDIPAPTGYGAYPVAQCSDAEAYVTFTDQSSVTKKTPIVGTGDGGNTWHVLWANDFKRFASGWGFQQGLVGPDKNGHIFAACYTTGNRIAKITPPTWMVK